mgnify:CR=1 FL=1|jgi:hypothetical protein
MKKIFWVCLLSLLVQSFFIVPVSASEQSSEDL